MTDRLTLARSQQFVKVTTVLLRDHSPLDLGEVLEMIIYCWRNTETEAQSRIRDALETTDPSAAQ